MDVYNIYVLIREGPVQNGVSAKGCGRGGGSDKGAHQLETVSAPKGRPLTVPVSSVNSQPPAPRSRLRRQPRHPSARTLTTIARHLTMKPLRRVFLNPHSLAYVAPQRQTESATL